MREIPRHGDSPSQRPLSRPLELWLEHTALRLGERLKELVFARVFTSPLQRARRTCELAGFGSVAEIDSDLVERNYSEWNLR
jgi:broad specificity phosphatase PhoE